MSPKDKDAFYITGSRGTGDEGEERGEAVGTVALLDEFKGRRKIGAHLGGSCDHDVMWGKDGKRPASGAWCGNHDAAGLGDEAFAARYSGIAAFQIINLIAVVGLEN